MKYDFLIAGAGLFGSVCARELTDAGYSCLVVDKREHIAGNCYSKKIQNIDVHWYGSHIFHTSSDKIWQYIKRFAEFNEYRHSVIANYKGELYSLPFNMWTFYQFWGVRKPEEARKIIESQRTEKEPTNLEEQAISIVGKEIYEKLIKGYTEKQWKEKAVNLPASIIKRIPVRYTYDTNYFYDKYQGIPKNGYTEIFENLLDGIKVELSTNYFDIRNKQIAKRTIYTGSIDKYYGFEFGSLPYRPLKFEHIALNNTNFQGTSVVNYTDSDTLYTRIAEHKHFNLTEKNENQSTIITKEYPIMWTGKEDPIYPINTKENDSKYLKYKNIDKNSDKVFFGGRLAEYRYYDMHQVIGSALKLCEKIK